MKKFNQLYRMLHSNPHQFGLISWSDYFLLSLDWHHSIEVFRVFIVFECHYYIWSYPPVVISYILHIILFPLWIIIEIIILKATAYVYIPILFIISLIIMVTYVIISLILLPLYYLTDCNSNYPMNIELCKAYYMFGSNPDLDPPVIIDEMSDKLRSIVDNYRPLSSTTSFDYLRFVKETKTIKYTEIVSEGDGSRRESNLEKNVTGAFIEFIKHA